MTALQIYFYYKIVDTYMHLKQYILTVLVFLLTNINELLAQQIDNTPVYRHINNEGYFRFSYENDFFSATDKYYTQGIDAELALPRMDKLLITKLLIHPHYNITIFGVGLQHNGFTPSSISSDEILSNDRPFAAILLAKSFVIATDTIHMQRFSTTLHLGIIGQAAGAKEMQEFIHDKLNNITPHGWQHQINNDFAVNYQVNYDKQLLRYKQLFSLTVGGGGSLGTINTNLNTNVSILFGYINNPYDGHKQHPTPWSFYGYISTGTKFVLYNASLQGGILDNRSPHTLATSEITPSIATIRYGVRLSYRSIHLEYFKALQTREFKQGKPHSYGGLQISTSISSR